MISENNLIGWLCFLRMNGGSDTSVPIAVPREVSMELEKRGWTEHYPGDDGAYQVSAPGRIISDLHAPEWGINPVPVE